MRKCMSPAVAVCFFILVMITMIPPAGAYGIGIGPSSFQINNSLSGTSVERTITLFNLGDENSTIDLTADGFIAGWITFYDFDARDVQVSSVSITKRGSKIVLLRIMVPHDTPNGVYSTKIHARIKPADTTNASSGTTTTMEAISALSIIVAGEAKVGGTVEYITVDNVQRDSPVLIRVLFHNTGNITVKPEIRATISGKSGTVDSMTYAGQEVNAGTSDILVAQWTKASIEPGEYTADVTVYLTGNHIARKNVSFSIAASGTAAPAGTSSPGQKTPLQPGLAIPAIIGAMVLTALYTRRS